MPPVKRASPSPMPGATAARRDSGLVEDAARRDLAQRLDITEEQIEVVSMDRIEMPIGSLGCGEAGGPQNQGLIIGDEIVLRAQGQEYTYHSDGSKVILCPAPALPTRQPALGPAAGATAAVSTGTVAPAAQDMALADLAGRLGIKPAAITVREILEAEWPDASLGCPQPGMAYAQVITRGQVIVLEANGRTYEYHAGRGYVVLCRP